MFQWKGGRFVGQEDGPCSKERAAPRVATGEWRGGLQSALNFFAQNMKTMAKTIISIGKNTPLTTAINRAFEGMRHNNQLKLP